MHGFHELRFPGPNDGSGIAIRIMVRKTNCLYLAVGCGIARGPGPEAEYIETSRKGETFLKHLECTLIHYSNDLGASREVEGNR